MLATRPSRVTRLDGLAWRIHAEFTELPGLHLTFSQVQRLWHLSHDDCERVLGDLLRGGLLMQDGKRRFCLRPS